MSYKNSRNSSFKMKKGLDVDPDAGNRSCVYCHNDNGSFFDKNGDIKYGRHHVKNCCKGYYRRQEKKEMRQSKSSKSNNSNKSNTVNVSEHVALQNMCVHGTVFNLSL